MIDNRAIPRSMMTTTLKMKPALPPAYKELTALIVAALRLLSTLLRFVKSASKVFLTSIIYSSLHLPSLLVFTVSSPLFLSSLLQSSAIICSLFFTTSLLFSSSLSPDIQFISNVRLDNHLIRMFTYMNPIL